MSRSRFKQRQSSDEPGGNTAQKEKGQNRVKPQFYPGIIIPQLKHLQVLFSATRKPENRRVATRQRSPARRR